MCVCPWVCEKMPFCQNPVVNSRCWQNRGSSEKFVNGRIVDKMPELAPHGAPDGIFFFFNNLIIACDVVHEALSLYVHEKFRSQLLANTQRFGATAGVDVMPLRAPRQTKPSRTAVTSWSLTVLLLGTSDDSVMARGRNQVPSIKTGLAHALLGPMADSLPRDGA